MKIRFAVVAFAVLAVSCNKSSSPTAPTPVTSTPAPTTPAPTPAPAPAPIPPVTVAGVVSNANTGRALGGATVRIGNQQSATDGNGYYSIGGVAPGNITVTVTAPNYNNAVDSFALPVADTVRNIRIVPFWTVSGISNTVFDMPTYVTRVRVTGTYTGYSSNFIVKVGGRLLVNELIGTGWPQTTYDGVALTTGGVTEITNSSGVAWTFTQTQ